MAAGIPRRVCARYAGEDLRLSCDGGGARLHCQGRMSFRDDGTFNEKEFFFYLKKRVKEELRVECILYANGYGELARSDGAVELLERIREEEEHLQ